MRRQPEEKMVNSIYLVVLRNKVVIDHALKTIFFDELKIHLGLLRGVHREPGSVGRQRWYNSRRIVIANRPRSVPFRNVVERRSVELLLGYGFVHGLGHCELGELI